MDKKTLSASLTFYYKVLLPVFLISGLGAGTVALWLGTMRGENNTLPPDWMKWEFLGGWIVGSFFALRLAHLKKVQVDSECLYVSNYRREIRVPFNMIADVTENRWLNTHPVTVHFRCVTEFGDKITFLPTFRIFHWLGHPVVAELKRLANL